MVGRIVVADYALPLQQRIVRAKAKLIKHGWQCYKVMQAGAASQVAQAHFERYTSRLLQFLKYFREGTRLKKLFGVLPLLQKADGNFIASAAEPWEQNALLCGLGGWFAS